MNASCRVLLGSAAVTAIAVAGCCEAPPRRPAQTDLPIYYVEDGAQVVKPVVDLQFTVEPGGSLRNADGGPVTGAHQLADVLRRHAAAVGRETPIVIDLYTGGPETEQHLDMQGLASAVDRVRAAATAAGPQVLPRVTIHVHSALLTEARLARGQ